MPGAVYSHDRAPVSELQWLLRALSFGNNLAHADPIMAERFCDDRCRLGLVVLDRRVLSKLRPLVDVLIGLAAGEDCLHERVSVD